MTPIQKKNAQYAFDQLKLNFDKLTMPETKDYYLQLGNGNEVHLIRKDAKLSVFLGRLIVNNQEDLKPAMLGVWTVLRDYFLKPKEAEVEEATEVSGAQVNLLSEEETVEAKPTPKRKPRKKPDTRPVIDEVLGDTPVNEAPTDVPDGVEEDDPQSEGWIDAIVE